MTERLAGDLAAIVLREAGIPPHPPIDPVAVAEFLGVASIEFRPLNEDGRIESMPEGARIFVNSRTSPERQRFTLAHEIAHHLLSDPEQEMISYRARPLGYDATERFCDRFAASLLLPRPWVVQNFGDAPQSIRVIRKLAAESRVSFSAAFVRAHETLAWHVSMLRLRPRRDSWLVTELHKRSAGFFRWPKPTAASCAQLSEWARLGFESAGTSLALNVAGSEVWFFGEVSAHANSVVLLGTIASSRSHETRKSSRRLSASEQLKLF